MLAMPLTSIPPPYRRNGPPFPRRLLESPAEGGRDGWMEGRRPPSRARRTGRPPAPAAAPACEDQRRARASVAQTHHRRVTGHGRVTGESRDSDGAGPAQGPALVPAARRRRLPGAHPGAAFVCVCVCVYGCVRIAHTHTNYTPTPT